MLPEDDKSGLTRIEEHTLLDEVEQPLGQTGRQIGLEAQPAFACLLLQCLGLCNGFCLFLRGRPAVGRILGHDASHGLMSVRPQPSNPPTSRVAMSAPTAKAMAAISASKASIGLPARRRVVTISA